MNVGQILETHLGWAGHELGKKITQLLAENSKAEIVRRELKALFKDTVLADTIADLPDDELEAVARIAEGRRFHRLAGVRRRPRKRNQGAAGAARACRPPARRTCTTA